jgi:diguanylate cyclase (GGDEF)-like protein
MRTIIINTSFARACEWLGVGKRILPIVSPFLAIVAVLVLLAVLSIDILAAGRAYVEGESLWSKSQKEAVSHLLRYAETKAEPDFLNYQKAIRVPMGFHKARLELEKPRREDARLRAALLEGGTHPDDIPGVIKLYDRFSHVGYMQNVLDIWRTGDGFLAKLTAAADELHTLHQSGRENHARLQLILERIIQINEELRPWQNRFSNTLGEATRWLQSVLLIVILAAAATLVPPGVLLTQRMVNRVDRAEREIKDLKLQQEYATKLAHHASHDPLTDLVNRPEFENRVGRALRSASTQGQQHVVMYLDLDQFKIVNDTCGHAAGDQLLRQVGALLKQQLRDRDTLARLGGDEFGVMLENCPFQEAIRIADQLRQCITDFRFVSEDRPFTIGASIGVVQVADGTMSLTDVLSAADSACYMAKEKGRNRVQIYRPHDSDVSQRRGEMQWVPRLQAALEKDRFVLYEQEIVPLDSGTLRNRLSELLVRMLDEHGAVVPPMAFIPAAERYSMMTTIDAWVAQHAFAKISSLGPHCGTYAINISGGSLGDERFLDFVREQFKRSSMPPHTICFEITETAAVANFDKAARFFGEMKALGCLFSLDDFGAGMSSFGYLKQLPVDFIKIDGSFVKNLEDDPVDLATVRAINDLGHVMGKKTIGEFVERESGLTALREIGVDFAQGNWIAPPRPFLEPASTGKSRSRKEAGSTPVSGKTRPVNV